MSLASLSDRCTGRRATGLVCAYTGRPLVIHVSHSAQTGWLWFAEALSPPPSPSALGVRYPTLPALISSLGTRNGVSGVLSGEEALVCPYTGHPLTIAKDPAGFYATGGWSPFAPCKSLFRLEYFTRMRGGVPAPDTMEHDPVVASRPAEEPETLPKPTPSSKAEELAHEMTDKFLTASGKRTVISMAPKKVKT